MSHVTVVLLCALPVLTTELLSVLVHSPRLAIALGLSLYHPCATGAGLLSVHAYLDFSTAATSLIFCGSLDSSAREYRTVFVSRVHPLLRSWSGVLAHTVQNLAVQGPSPLGFLLVISGASVLAHGVSSAPFSLLLTVYPVCRFPEAQCAVLTMLSCGVKGDSSTTLAAALFIFLLCEFVCESLQGVAGIALESPDQKTRGFVV
jgi:hypothetical protein